MTERIWCWLTGVQSIVGTAIMAVIVCIFAQRLDFWQGWLSVACYFLFTVFYAAVLWDRPSLAKERIKNGPGRKKWDKVWLFFYKISISATFIIGAIDTGRGLWSHGTWPLTLAGLVVFPFAMWWLFRAMRVNDYFALVVRMQTDRGQKVCDRGPYAKVRHPGYVGASLWALSTGMILGSWPATAAAILTVALLVVRTYFEDKMLQSELEGYSEYAQRVKFRLLKGVW